MGCREARRFLESARAARDPFYSAYVLILVLGLRKGQVLGLTWDLVDLDKGELYIGEQLQRVGRRLLRRQVKTEPSESSLPLPDICVTALRLSKDQQEKTSRTQPPVGRYRLAFHDTLRNADRAAEFHAQL